MSAAKVPEKVGGFQGLEGSFSKGEDPEGQEGGALTPSTLSWVSGLSQNTRAGL